MSADSEKRKLSAPKPSSRDSNRFKYLVQAQPNSTGVATLSSPGSDDDQTQDQNKPDEQQSHSQAHEALQSSAFCYKPGCNEKEMKVKPATSFKIIYSIC